MKFPEVTLRLVKVNKFEKEGRVSAMVKLACEKTFDSFEAWLSREQSPDLLVEASRYKVTLDFDKFSSVTLVPETAK